MRLFIYLSEILGTPIIDAQDRCVGRLVDISLRLNDEVFPKADSFVVRKGFFKRKYARISFQDFVLLDQKFKLKIDKEQVNFQDKPFHCDFTITRDILDQQVVDTHEQKVVRVNDVHLLRVDNQLYLAHVDVGLRGLVRRLGWSGFVDVLVRIFSKDSPYLKKEELLSWRNSQVLTLGRSKNVLKMKETRNKLAKIPPTELAEIMEDLDIFEKLSLFKSFTADLQYKVFTDMALQEKEELIDQLSDREAANLLENIPADEATDLLHELPKDQGMKWLRLMHNEASKRLRKLLGFAQDSAGGLMTTEYLYLNKEATVKDAFDKLKKFADYPGNLFYIYILDEEYHLLGTTSFRRFINAELDTPIMETCYPTKIFVHTDDGVEEIALLLEKYKFSSIPVLDENDVIQGVITSDDVMEELIALTWSKYKDQL